MSVLIITKSDDNESIALVTDAIKERGGRAYRFDTDRFPTELKLTAAHDKTSERVTVSGPEGDLDLGGVTAIWHRRLNVGGRLPASMDNQLRQACIGESRATFYGLLASLDAFRMDRAPYIRHAENKQLQLRVAAELGLETPRTLITNEPDPVRDFMKACEGRVITKMLSSFAIYEEGREKVVFTNPVSPDDLEDLGGLSYCPMTFQEMVPKALELRVTLVGDRVFAASIDSQSSDRALHDWRRDGLGMIDDWKEYELPEDVTRRLLRLMDYFGLNYGAVDIIVTPEGRHVFLEINPVGEFFWLERVPGLPISKAIADVLLGRSPRRVRALWE
ncbi:MAG TPA: MvdD family ATP-grasp ribosomal peptide maturase [Blastocatellia bacterium]|jgi:MvdD family ATP-grasp ribosomal peptide maturase|nr:MvdD family ATP-grasp ribosomal peptide maturase [Blastocatellia bacterium]